VCVQSSVNQFYQTQAQLEQYRERERLNVPVYGNDLSKVVAEFEKHIADMHFRHVTCKTLQGSRQENPPAREKH